MTLRGNAYQVTGDTGVFSGHRLDRGTEVLLRKVPAPSLPAGGIGLDLGCGWGPITLALAAELPATAEVWAVDINERARHLATQNAAAAGFSPVVLDPDSALDRLGNRRISLIWSNPPVRIGKEALHKLLLTWFSHLSDDAEAYCVVQRNLGSDSLASWLTDQGYPTEKLASQKGFRVLRTVRG